MDSEPLSLLLEDLQGMLEQTRAELTSEFRLSELTHRQLHYLETIAAMKNPGVSDLARQLGLSKPSVSVIVNRLADQDFVRKVPSDRDRRSAHIHLTRKGEKVRKLHQAWHRRIGEIIDSRLTGPERRALETILGKIIHHPENGNKPSHHRS